MPAEVRKRARKALAILAAALSAHPAAGDVAQFGAADVDPNNDEVVAPPDPDPECEAKLVAMGIAYRPATLPVKRRGGFDCGAPDVVVYRGTALKIRWSAPPVVSCGMALALA